jgi:Fe-S cluster assembly protein SufD
MAGPDETRFLETMALVNAIYDARHDAWRAAGRAAFERLGFPGRKDEEWRFTPIARLTETSPVAGAVPDERLLALAAKRVEAVRAEFDDAKILVLFNGHLLVDLSTVSFSSDLPVPSSIDEPFEAINAAFTVAPVVLRLTATRPSPLVILHLYADDGAAYPRLHLELDDGVAASLVEIHEEIGAPAAGLTVAMTTVSVGVGARLEHLLIEHRLPARRLVALTRLSQAARSEARTTAVTLGAGFVRNTLRVELAGEGAVARLDGLYLVRSGEFVDNHTAIEHALPHGESHELYKGILDGSGRGVFNGKIMVRKGAQKTVALQTNRNLVLSDEAVIDAKPQLEIFADDVKCTHGATVGQLDDEALFYLRSRGLSAPSARRLLLSAFAGEILAGIGVAGAAAVLMRELEEVMQS